MVLMTKLISVFQNSSKRQRNFSSVKSVLFFTAFLIVKTGASVSGKIQPASAEFFDSNKITLLYHKIQASVSGTFLVPKQSLL